MSYKRQRLQESHIFTNQEDCSFNTPQLENECPSSSYGVLTQSSTLERNRNRFPNDSQRCPLVHGEASSSNAPLPTQNEHNHHPSDSTSPSLVEDHVQPESAPSSNDLGFSISDHETIGQASYQRRRGRISYAYIDFGDKTFKCCHCMALFWMNERLAHSIYWVRNQRCSQCIRAYNSMFAFTSMGVTIDQSVNRQSGPYVFKINGHCHHLMGSLLPSNDNAPKFAQLYIYDVSNEVSNRMSQFPNSLDSCLDQTIVSDLIKMLASTNCLVGLFRHASQKLSEPNNPGYKLQLLCQRTNDSTEYSNPTSDDIGGLIVGDIGAYQSERDIIIESFSNTLQRISKLHPKFMALQYPLLFPFGEDGYRTNINFADNDSNVSGKRHRVPMRGFYAYLIQEREYGEDTLTKVVAYTNNFEDRLDYIRMNQNDLRSDLYQNISEAVLKGDVEGSSTGKIILPSSFTGSPRYMINNYQDAMAICRAYGNPDLFITFTCNTKWPEIERELDKSRAYKPEDKPDIITRIFRSKLLDMLKFIKSGAPFGETIAAEIPDKNIDPLCHDIVSKFMIHGPCGVAKPTHNACQEIRREFRDNFVQKNGIMLFNDYVVPYNKELLLRYNAHINVEICCQSMLIKYLFKYVNKSPDRCRAVIQHDRNDEIQAYLNCRFICPYEAVWRIFQFPIHSRSPSVERLQIHLPFQQNIVFSGSESLQSVLRRPGIRKTMLTEWFECNKQFPYARELYYSEFPKKFVWDSRQKQWTIRSKGHSLGRIPYVHPAAGELYFLRLLLNHIKGSTSFADLRNVHGFFIQHFSLPAKHLDFRDDKEWSEAFCEAIVTASSPQLRQLFVGIILFCQVADPLILFNQVWHSMYDDILYKLKASFRMPNLILPHDQLKNYVLYELEQLFNASATTLQDHSLPMPNGQLLKEITNKLLREELDYDLTELRSQHSLNFASLNHGQKLSLLKNKLWSLFMVMEELQDFLWHTIINRVRSESLIVLAVASSGIASLLLPNGRTAHSRFKIPLSIDELSTCAIKKNTHLSNLLQKTALIVWDEAPMVNKCCLEALDRSMRDVLSEGTSYNKNLPFGGKTILLGGDFRQILPVIPGGTKEQIINASLTSSIFGSKITIMTLTENMRLSTDGLSLKKVKLMNPLSLFLSIFSFQLHIDPGYYRERAIVTTKNTTVAEINDFVLRITPGTKRVYLSVDSVSTSSTESDDASSLYPIEYINQLEFNGVPSHELALKIGTPGNAIQASAKGKNIGPFAASIIEGDYYQVNGFYTFENRSVVSHEAIIDLKGEELRITLWGDVAKRFNDSDLANQSSPLIMAGFRITEFKGKPNLASTVASLWYFNPEIKEILPYKHYYKDIPVEVHQLPSTTTPQTIDQQLKENRRTIKEILCIDPYEYKSQRFTCKASIADYDLHRGWWYHSCPLCTKSVSDKGAGFKCIEHNDVTPVPWFRVDCIVTDGTDVTTFLMVGKTAENFFGSSAHSYVYDKGFIDSIPTPMIDKLQKPKIFQLRFGTFRSMMNRCDIIVANVFDDITEVESPQQHITPELHDSNVPFMEQASASSSSKDPVTPAPIPPSRADIASPSPSHAKKKLLFDDDTPVERCDPISDPSASTIPEEDEQPKKRHCPSKSLDD
uniref:ATP-dependent DNA helicase n=1 Tax=Salix viminalis TaxID=40686 RepID=A0A6N2MDD8_SALVM